MFEPYKYKGCTITISPDPDPTSPREDDNLGTMICCHPRYNLGDKQVTAEDIRDAVNEFGPDAIVLPLFLYDHSGITMNTTGFHCPWDSGQVGYICIRRDAINVEFGEIDDEAIEAMLRQEVEVYDSYISGEVYGFEIEYDSDTMEDDACWGFYGYDYCKSEAEEEVDFALDNRS